MLKTKILLPAVFLLALNLFGGAAHAVDNPSASLSMSGSAYTPGATFSVTIFENSGSQGVNVVEADLNYDPTQLDFIGIDSSTSAFNGFVKAKGGQGEVSIERFIVPGAVNGSVPVSTVTFKALAGTTSSTINFAPFLSDDDFGSKVYSYTSGSNIYYGQNDSATFSFITPLPPATPPPVAPAKTKTVARPVVAKTAPPPLFSNQTSVEGLSLSKTLNDFKDANTPPASNPLTSFFVASWLAVATCVAMYFNAHQKIARHAVRISRKSAQHISRKRLALQARRQTRHLA